MRIVRIVAAVGLAIAAGVTGTPVTAAESGGHDVARANTANALQLLKKLKVHGEANGGYDRDKFADWYDADRDGCDTRAEVLIAESLKKVRRGAGCYVRTGKWFSRFDGQVFKRASELDIDHMVPLAEAWGSGAKKWNDSTRDRYANDLGYLFSLNAVSASSNRSKSDRDPSEWLPTRTSYRCTYAKQYTAVKWRWNLSVNDAELWALRAQIRKCNDRTILKPARADIDRRGTGGGGGGGGGRCDPNYAGACIPIVKYDLDCSDIPDRNFRVVGRDIHGFDGDGDRIACET